LFLKKQAERKEQFFTIGDIPVKRTYTAADIAETPIEDIGLPGRYPFTRGPYPTMYRSRPGRCARSRASAPARTPTSASSS
jgi:methylmalonyl-CoA mutase N-terminal domain/subunit